MTYAVYHIRNGTVSIVSFSHQNIEERHSMSQGSDVGRMLQQLCEWKHVNIIEAEVCVDHVHMLVNYCKMSVSGFVGYLKEKRQMIFERWANADLSIEINHFGVEGFMRIRFGKNLKPLEVYTESAKEDHIALGTIGIRNWEESVYRKT